MSEDQRPFVVVGGGLAGGKAVEALREAGYEGPLVLVSAEQHRPYERPPLSKDLLLGNAERDSVFVHPAEWYDEHDVELVLGDAVERLDTDKHEIVTASGRTLTYAKLLLATGSEPRRLPLPDLDAAHAERVLSLRTLDDSERLKTWLRPDVRLVVVGGGWIGLEVAAAARQAGSAVTVIEAESLPLQRVLGREIAEVFAAAHREHGVDLRTSVSVKGIEADGDALLVRLSDGQVPADVVLAGIGITPRTELAEQAGLEVDNGVVTDAQLRTSDPDVFASGDVANALYTALGRRLRVEHWATAMNQPAVAARAMLGGDETFDLQPYFFTDQYDLGMEYHGFADPSSDRLVVRGELTAAGFVAVWLDSAGQVTAAMHVNQWDDGDAVKALVGTGSALDVERFQDQQVPLADVPTS